jgi:hypothetical protein
MGDRPRSISGVAQEMNLTAAVDDDAERSDRQRVGPFGGEDLRALQKRLRQPDAPGIVMTQAPSATTARPRSRAWRQMSAP